MHPFETNVMCYVYFAHGSNSFFPLNSDSPAGPCLLRLISTKCPGACSHFPLCSSEPQRWDFDKAFFAPVHSLTIYRQLQFVYTQLHSGFIAICGAALRRRWSELRGEQRNAAKSPDVCRYGG